MYIRISLRNPRDIDYSENFPNPQDALILRLEDDQVFTYSNGDWIETYQSKSTISTFYRVSKLMARIMVMHAANLQEPVYSEEEFNQIIEQLQILTTK